MCEKMWLDEFAMVRLRRFVQFHQGQASSTKVKRVPPRSNEFHQGQASSTKVKRVPPRSSEFHQGQTSSTKVKRVPPRSSIEAVDSRLVDLMQQCWLEDPAHRPAVAAVLARFTDITQIQSAEFTSCYFCIIFPLSPETV